jgi:hypothetical protein
MDNESAPGAAVSGGRELSAIDLKAPYCQRKGAASGMTPTMARFEQAAISGGLCLRLGEPRVFPRLAADDILQHPSPTRDPSLKSNRRD